MLTNNYDKNIQIIKNTLQPEESFDLIERKIVIKNHRATMYFSDGLTKDEIVEKLMEFFYKNAEDSFFENADTFADCCVPYIEVETTDDEQKITTDVLSGMCALMIENFSKAILLDTRTYPQRETSEPENDKVLRGSKDGFVETIVFNTALVRRRIRDPRLRIKALRAGSKSKTDIAVCYMEDKVDKKLLKELTKRIENIKAESLTMNQQSLIENLYPNLWLNPFPKIKHTERPDTAASAIIKGNIVIFVDNSPSAILMPTSIFDLLEEADDFYFSPVTGTYLRLARYFITTLSVVITPLWLLFLQNPNYVPDAFKFILIDEVQNIPILFQLLIIEVGIDGLRLASLNTPSSLTTPLSIIGAIALSDFAVKSGWFSGEAILYMAFVTIANYTQPSYELGYSLKFCRILLLILTAIFNLWGFIAGNIINLIILCTNKTISGKSYLYPLVPFNGKELLRKLIRVRTKE
ncbi:MAG: spore germination protein [Ruminococcus sp.]|nr:spore germination protein [Ruminococcus sp.]